MQTLVFPFGILIIKEESGHDGLFIWPENYWTPALPGVLVPTPIPPTNMRAVPCPKCGSLNHFWALHRQVPHMCLDCMHHFAVVSVPVERWAMAKPYLHSGNPWLYKSYKPVIPAYPGAPLYDEVDECPESETRANLLTVTRATNTTLLVMDASGNIVWL